MINVVAAVITDEHGKILIAQRNLNKSQGGLWEFPGGKIELNETKEEAIVREIKEELNMEIKVEYYIGEKSFTYPTKEINLIALKCSKVSKNYEVLEHENIAWITKEEINKYEFAPADIFIVNSIKKV